MLWSFLPLSLLLSALSLSSSLSLSPVSLSLSSSSFHLQNGFTSLEFSSSVGGFTSLSADFSGNGKYGDNLLSLPFSLSLALSSSLSSQLIEIPSISVRESSEEKIVLEISSLSYGESISNISLVTEKWIVSLEKGKRFIDLSIEGNALKSTEIISLSHGFYTSASSLYAFFEKGVFQMKDNTDSCLGSDQTLSRAYVLGHDRSLDLTVSSSSPSEYVFYSAAKSSGFVSGIQHVIRGSYPRKSLMMEKAWSRLCWSNATATQLSAGDSWTITFQIGVNNMDFPVFPVSNAATQPKMSELDIRSFLTGIYASPPGCLQSYYEKRDGTIAPTLATPEYGYSPNTNFFDPDNFISISAMLFSGDQYLTNEVRKILERTAETMCGIGKDQDVSYCSASSVRNKPLRGTPSPHPLREQLNPRDGQLMHHYINLIPTYESIATSEQLGPNIFWTLSALRYASVTGDLNWLIQMEPFLSLSGHFLFSFYDEDVDLLLVPGPLWIDVVVRENYTSDSNAIVPYIFREFADGFDLLHQSNHPNKETHLSYATELRRIADEIVKGMNQKLWHTEDDDHYITQLNQDLSTTRDFIDYDSNLLAIAFDVAPQDRIPKILTRVDSGPYTHVRGTWCSEVPYTGDACDCYIVGGSVCGDSIVTLGRIGWADAIARKKVGDLKTFEQLLLEPLQADLVKDTWLYERYDSNGNQIRTAYYFEYPSLVAMMLTEIRYGLELTLNRVVINPFQSKEKPLDYSFKFGSIGVEYNQQVVKLSLPGTGFERDISIYSLSPSTEYVVSFEGNTAECSSLNGQVLSSDSNGMIHFSSPIYSDCSLLLSSSSSVV